MSTTVSAKDDLLYQSIGELGARLRRREITSLELTELSLDLASEAGCAIDVKVDKQPVWAFVDPALLRVVLSNLIGNALDVLAAKADTKPGTVRISLDASEREAKLRVVDDGPGIPDALRGHLFEPFQTTKPSGTGLGLAVVKTVAEAHGGALALHSQLERGTRIDINLLRVAAAKTPDPPAPVAREVA